MSHNFRSVFFLLIFQVFAVAAGVDAGQNQSPNWLGTKINHNWADLSQDDYLKNMVVCQLKIQAHKWQKNIWPAENKAPKPPFSEVVDVQQAHRNVMDLLKKQAVLYSYFKISINDSMLQNDINRMASNTKDSESLKSLFAVLDNHPQTIAECIARPTVVEQNFEKAFAMNKVIHQSTKQQAEAELLLYRQDKSDYLTTGKEQHITYVLQHAENKEGEDQLEQHEYKGYLNKLDYSQFQSTKNKLSREKLQETDRAFYFSDTITQSDQHIEVKTWLWEKQTSYEWLDQQKIISNQYFQSKSDFYLPVVSQNKWQSGEKSHNPGNLWAPQTTPYGMTRHTAVWTGSHMIVWGGETVGDYNGWSYEPSTDFWAPISNTNAPSNRSGHTAIWTGTHMIVWGGYNLNNFYQDGGVYDPLTDTWAPVNVTGAPEARTNHTSIWTGTEMIVWGGSNISFPSMNSGGVYNPQTEQWTVTSQTNVPDARYDHTAVWTDNLMIVWGGSSTFGVTLDTGGSYNPANDQWNTITTTNAPSSRFGHSAVWTGSQMVVWGGNASNYWSSIDYITTGGMYDPVADLWTATSNTNTPIPRLFHSSVWTGTHMVIWGGRYFDDFFNEDIPVNSGKRYDPVNDIWSNVTTANAPEVRSQHTAVWTGTEMLLWGGENDNGRLNSGGKYDPVGNSWLATGPVNLPTSREEHVAVWTGNEMVVWGGTYGLYIVRTGGAYEPSTDTWTATSLNNSPNQRVGSTAVWTGSEVIVWGGFDGGAFASSGKRYDPTNNVWNNMTNTNAPTGRTYHVAVWSGNEMIVWGGDQFGSTRFNSGGVYDPDLNTWTLTNTIDAPPGSAELAAVWTGNEMIVWGGIGDNGAHLNSGGVYDLVQDSWVITNQTGAPTARANHTAVWTGDRMIVWGGVGTGVGLGYLYDPVSNTWSVTSSNSAPSNKIFHSAVWTGLKMVVWGGSGGGSGRAGGVYDPVVDIWTPTSLVQAPTARSNHASVWTGNEMIVWGGQSNVMGVFTPHGSYHISGNLNGLNGDQVVLQNNGGDDLILSDNGSFSFSQSVDEGMDYSVTVLTNPLSPAQTCSIVNGSGAHVIADVNDIEVNCVDDFFNLGVIVTGLASGTELGLLNNGGDPLTVDTDSQLTYFPTQVGNGQSYLITIDSQPTGPNQTCTITPGEESGTINDADALANIDCVTNEYLLGVDVSGLEPGDTVSFVNDFNEFLPISTDGLHEFADAYVDGTPFQVTLILQPTNPDRTCSFVDPNSGVFSGMDQYVGVVCAASDLIFADGFE